MIRAEIRGDDTATTRGLTVRAPAPVLALCRKLIAAGADPSEPLEAYRGETLCLRVRSIGEGAKLTVEETPTGPRFVKYKSFDDARARLKGREKSGGSAAGSLKSTEGS